MTGIGAEDFGGEPLGLGWPIVLNGEPRALQRFRLRALALVLWCWSPSFCAVAYHWRARFTSARPPATRATAATNAAVNGSPSTRWPAATPNSGARKVNADSRLAE